MYKLFELFSFMQTALPHENDVEDFFLAHIQFPGIGNVDIAFSISEQSLYFGLPVIFGTQ